MLRSPTGRPAAVSFLQTVAALIFREPVPDLEFFGIAAEGDRERGGEDVVCTSVRYVGWWLAEVRFYFYGCRYHRPQTLYL